MTEDIFLQLKETCLGQDRWLECHWLRMNGHPCLSDVYVHWKDIKLELSVKE